MNPFAWTSVTFVLVYVLLFLLAFAGGPLIAAWLRPDGRALPVDDEDELALLAGDTQRLTETVVARMLARGRAEIADDGFHFEPAQAGDSDVERQLAKVGFTADWETIHREAQYAAGRIEDSLVGRGLLMSREEAQRLSLLAALPLFALCGLAGLKAAAGLLQGGSIFPFVVIAVGTGAFALMRVRANSHATRGGIAALEAARERWGRLMVAPTRAECGMAVALFGTSVLTGSPLAGLHDARKTANNGGGGGCGGGGCSGCGGGGCGG
jgi:uncharacterized protein (TIGR04222 family)